MTAQDLDVRALHARLDVVERQNRRFKSIGTIVVLALSVTLLMGQARTNKVVEANEFILKDASGKVRGRLGIGATGLPLNAPTDLASLELYDSAAKPMVRLIAATGDGAFSLGPSSSGMAGVGADANNKGATLFLTGGATGAGRKMLLNADPTETSIVLGSVGEKHGISLTDGDSLKSPSVVVFDAAGFEAQLGVAHTTVTASGQQRKTSAASLILLGKDGNVMWSAP